MRTIIIGAHSAPYMMIAHRGVKDETSSRLSAPMLCVMLLFCTALIVTSPAWAAGESGIAVVYPDIGEPYRGIFEKIIEGIEAKAGDRVTKQPLNSGTDIGALKASLLRENTKVVIALGRQGMKTATVLNSGIGVVVGGVLTVPESEARGQPVISLSPDPALLFARMKALMPATKRVFVVYDPAYNDWLINLAKEAARAQELELVAYEAQDLRSAVRYYQEIFSAADSHSDVLWLPQDSTTVEESSVLPMVLQESWNRDIAVFSSNSAHVRRGVLFSLYPDNLGLGKSLAELALGFLRSGDYEKSGMMPLRNVQTAVNLRTAKHLRLKPSRLQGFETTFPEQ
ncbi:MAG: ABC transporter substrate binding protein [Pseudomonadota bacterium]